MVEDKKPPPFYCPQCGQKHRADLSELEGKDGAVAQVTCAGCGLALGVTLDEDGLPVCRATEDSIGSQPVDAPVEESAAPAAAPVPARRKDKAPPSPGVPGDEPGQGRERESTLELETEFSEGDGIDRYTIEAVVGEGGTSTVYRAFDPTTNRTVALKVIKEGQSEAMQERFRREIEVQANIRHPNIMPVFDRGELPDGRPYFTMELLYNPWSLTEIIEHRDRGTLGRYTTLRDLEDIAKLVNAVIVPVCDGIYVSNVENGVVHRDLKPDNVLIDSRTLRPYVIDFGICEAIERKSAAGGPVVEPTADQAGIVGTPRYLAPEQAKGSVNPRTDVWGLGALIYFCVAGEPPIAGGAPITRGELKRRIHALRQAKQVAVDEGAEHRVALCDEKLARLEDDGLRTIEDIFKDAREGNYADVPVEAPSALGAVIRKAMSVSHRDRYVNARQLSDELRAWLKGSGVRALREAGGKAAAVESAKRAVRTYRTAGIWVLVGALAGALIGWAAAGKQVVGSSTRVEDAYADADLLEKEITELEGAASDLTPVEAHRFWASLMARADHIQARIADEPASEELAAVERRVQYVRGRIEPVRVVIDVPEGTRLSARNTVTGAPVAVTPGENAMPPGAYLVSVGPDANVRVPLSVPFRVRAPDRGPDLEPPIATVRLPVKPTDVPDGLVLVLGAEVRARDLPFAEQSLPQSVGSFLMGRREITNGEYALFLDSLGADEQKARAPAVGFVADAKSGLPTLVKGKANLPVVGVRPLDAAAYADWRSAVEGRTFRLPSEAEWALAAGAALGYRMPNDAPGFRTDGAFVPPLAPAGEHAADESPFGVRGLLANARELVTSTIDAGDYLAKGAGVGDEPDEGAIYLLRRLKPKDQHPTTGFRLVQELP